LATSNKNIQTETSDYAKRSPRWRDELAAASISGLLCGWALWWLSRLFQETAHIVDLLLEAGLHLASTRLDPALLGRWGGPVWLPLLAGGGAALAGVLLSPLAFAWGSRVRHRTDAAERWARQFGVQIGGTLFLWSLVEVKSVAFEVALAGSPQMLLLLLLGATAGLIVGSLAAAATRPLLRALGSAAGERGRAWIATRERQLAAAVLVLVLGALTAALRQEPAGSSPEQVGTLRAQPVARPSRVLVIGIDSANFTILDPLLRAGKLPHLQRLFEEGSGGRLRAVMPPFSPPVWTTIATGVRPAQHGIEGFTVPIPGDWRSELINSGHRRAPTLWEVASAAHLPVRVFGWYASYPATPVNGIMISDRAAISGLPGRTYPDSLNGILERTLTRTRANREVIEHLLAPFEGIQADEAAALPVLAEEITEDQLVFAMADSLLRSSEWRLGMVYVRATDSSQHLLWKYRVAERYPRIAATLWGELDRGAIKRRATTIDSIYAWTDAQVGRLVDAAGPEATIIVVSDHGGGPRLGSTPSYNLNPLLEALGLQVGSDGAVDLSRSMLYERVDEMAFWNPERKLHMALRGRELNGTLDPTRATEVRGRAMERLRAVHRDDGRALFNKIEPLPLRPDDPLAADLRLRIAPGLRPEMQLLLPDGGELSAEMIAPPSMVSRFSGNHRMDGIIVASGPGIRSGGRRLMGACALDVAPTAAVLLGLPVAATSAGRVLREIFDDSWLAAHAPRSVESWGERLAADTPASNAADEEIRGRLRALGYIQ
jgi:predicted AlkP superfamily phosphohydrolase/phosphomutase